MPVRTDTFHCAVCATFVRSEENEEAPPRAGGRE